MKKLSKLIDEAHQINSLRETQRILNEVLILLDNNNVNEAKLIIKKLIK